MNKDFEKLIEQVMDENDAVLRTLAEIEADEKKANQRLYILTACLLYTSPSPRDRTRSRMPSSA